MCPWHWVARHTASPFSLQVVYPCYQSWGGGCSVQCLTLALSSSCRVEEDAHCPVSIPGRLQSNLGMKTLQLSCCALILFLSLPPSAPPIYFFNQYEILGVQMLSKMCPWVRLRRQLSTVPDFLSRAHVKRIWQCVFAMQALGNQQRRTSGTHREHGEFRMLSKRRWTAFMRTLHVVLYTWITKRSLLMS